MNNRVLLILFFISIVAIANVVETFNRATSLSSEKKYKEAIELLERSLDKLKNEDEEVKFKYYYQLGTLKCYSKQYQACIKDLTQAFVLRPKDKAVKNNLELAYRHLKGKSKKKSNSSNKKQKQKQKQQQQKNYKRKYNTAIQQQKYSEKKAIMKRFQKNKSYKDRRFEKDW